MKDPLLHITRKGVVVWFFVLICSGCTFLSQLTGKREKVFVHTVKWPGETVSLVAKWYTGSMDNWKQIAKINPGLNPEKIVIGDKIIIPDRLLKTAEPLPENYVSEFYTRPKNTPVPSETAAPPRVQEKKPAPLQPQRPAEPSENIPSPVISPRPPAEAKPAASPQSEASQESQPAPLRPASEKQPTGSEDKPQPEEKEPVLFGPKGYSN